MAKKHQRQYQQRKAAGLCTKTGCAAKAASGHTHCGQHLQRMSRDNKERYERRADQALCIYCGERPQFWGVRCLICRQRFAQHPLPLGARRALRLYREDAKKHQLEQLQVETRQAVRKLLASGDLSPKCAQALKLYTGIDDGQWRTYQQVGRRMQVSKEWVRQLLLPSKIILARILEDRAPWQLLRQRTQKKRQSPMSRLKKIPPLAIHLHPPGRHASHAVR